MDEIKCTIPAPVLNNTVIVLKGYGDRLEGAIDVLSTIPAGRRLVEPTRSCWQWSAIWRDSTLN